MSATPQPAQSMQEQQIRAALDQHWAASDANDFVTEHLIYHEDAVLDYPQSGERTRGRANIQAQRSGQPEQQAVSRAAHRRQRRAVGDRIYSHLRWQALLHREHHGVHRRQSFARDAVLRRSLSSSRLPREFGRADGQLISTLPRIGRSWHDCALRKSNRSLPPAWWHLTLWSAVASHRFPEDAYAAKHSKPEARRHLPHATGSEGSAPCRPPDVCPAFGRVRLCRGAVFWKSGVRGRRTPKVAVPPRGRSWRMVARSREILP